MLVYYYVRAKIRLNSNIESKSLNNTYLNIIEFENLVVTLEDILLN